MLAGRVAQGAERQQELVQKNDPGCARQGVEVERNRAQTRIALTNDVDRLQRGEFKPFLFFLALTPIFYVCRRFLPPPPPLCSPSGGGCCRKGLRRKPPLGSRLTPSSGPTLRP